MPFTESLDEGGNAVLGLGSASFPSTLMKLMEMDAIDPGSTPGYEAAKLIYVHHPLGPALVDRPLEMAMSQERILKVPGCPEEPLIKAFKKEWKRIGTIGADNIIFRAVQLSNIYGISTLGVNYSTDGVTPAPTNELLPLDKLWELDLYFNIYDPLNTAGSLVLNQDPDAVDFMHPKQVKVGGKSWSNTKALVLMHEQPIWIQWSDSAFGFVGRSVFQRAFYPLKSFLVSMIADQMVQDKLGLIVYKAASPGSTTDGIARFFKSMVRTAIKGARTNNVLSIGETESIETLDLQHVATAGEYSRNNIIKNIATASGRPAIFMTQETLAEGFGEGSEDAKRIARFIDGVRIEMNPAYEFMDNLVMRRAWNPTFFAMMQERFPERYAKLTYEAALQEWMDAFEPEWPNLLAEPDSDKAKGAQAKLEAATKLADSLFAVADPETKGAVAEWLADVANEQNELFSSPLLIDAEDIASYEPPMQPIGAAGDNAGD